MFFQNKKSKNKKDFFSQSKIEQIEVKLERLLQENQELHKCLYKLHSQLVSQLHELKELSQHSTFCSTFIETPMPSPRVQTRMSDRSRIKEINKKLQRL